MDLLDGFELLFGDICFEEDVISVRVSRVGVVVQKVGELFIVYLSIRLLFKGSIQVEVYLVLCFAKGGSLSHFLHDLCGTVVDLLRRQQQLLQPLISLLLILILRRPPLLFLPSHLRSFLGHCVMKCRLHDISDAPPFHASFLLFCVSRVLDQLLQVSLHHFQPLVEDLSVHVLMRLSCVAFKDRSGRINPEKLPLAYGLERWQAELPAKFIFAALIDLEEELLHATLGPCEQLGGVVHHLRVLVGAEVAAVLL